MWTCSGRRHESDKVESPLFADGALGSVLARVKSARPEMLGRRRVKREKLPAQREVLCSGTVRHKSVMPDPDEAFRQDVQEKSPDELCGRQSHHALGSASPIISVPESDDAALQIEEPSVRDGDAVRVAREILKNLLGRAEGRLRIEDPLLLFERLKESSPCTLGAELSEPTGENETLLLVRLTQIVEVLRSKETTKHAYR